MATTETRSRRWFRRRGEHAEDRALTRETVPSVFFEGTGAGPSVTPRNAVGIVDVWACVRVLAQTASTLPLHTFRKAADGTRTKADSDLLQAPAPGVTPSAFISQLVAGLALHGEAFVGKYRASGDIVMLGLLAPDRVTITIGADGEPTYAYTGTDGKPQRLSRRDVCHVRLTSLDGVRGASPIATCRESLGLSQALADHAAASATGGYRPLGIATIAAGPGAEDLADNLKAQWDLRHSKPNRTAFVTSAVTYTALSTPARDAEFVEQRKLATVDVAKIFGVPAWMINADAGSSMTYSNTETQAAAFVKFALSPYLVAIEQAFTADEDLVPPGDCYARFSLEGLLRPDSTGRASFYTQALDPARGWMTRAEVRALEDLPPEPESPEPALPTTAPPEPEEAT